MEKKTVQQIIEIEPRIKEVFYYAKNNKKQAENVCVLYEQCKNKLINLVGFSSQKTEIANTYDYESCVIKLSEILNL